MRTELQVGVTPPGRFEQISFAERRAALELVADVGLDHVFFADHVSFKNGFGMDGLIQAAAFSQCHERLWRLRRRLSAGPEASRDRRQADLDSL